MRILLIEPFYTGSHKKWCDGFQKYSSHQIELATLSGRHWKWRMHGGAVEIARSINPQKVKYDLIVVSDFLDLAAFKALYWDTDVKFYVYFHENQITYPWSSSDQDVVLKRDNHYGWINYTTSLVADSCLFNSDYHRNSFIDALPEFLKQFPDGYDLGSVAEISSKSRTLYLGMDLVASEPIKNEVPVILWNHRWEYDKNPESFFNALNKIKDLEWNLIVLGESFSSSPDVFARFKDRFHERTIQWGYVETIDSYREYLSMSDVLLVTANQDFFGGSVVEAMYAGVHPILPNRLAYPEHVGEDLMYSNYADMLLKLTQAIQEFESNPCLSSSVEKYNWKNCISFYDSTLDYLVNHNGSKVVP
ncbi:MAG: glycosyltransferase involved in cell wall biosynthesis [Parvicellaceae bacterium]|jgi:glycosyltransferase involved in cell wall biosynthesis